MGRGLSEGQSLFLFEKKQKVMSFLSARMKELKKASTQPSLPYMEGCKQRIAETANSLRDLVSRDDAMSI